MKTIVATRTPLIESTKPSRGILANKGIPEMPCKDMSPVIHRASKSCWANYASLG